MKPRAQLWNLDWLPTGGEYTRVGELGPNSTEQELNAPYTLREIVASAR